jgi:hypothetical protein
MGVVVIDMCLTRGSENTVMQSIGNLNFLRKANAGPQSNVARLTFDPYCSLWLRRVVVPRPGPLFGSRY